MSETKTTTEDSALIEWKKGKVNFDMKKFQRKVYGKHGNLQVRTSKEEYSNSEGTNSPSVTLEILTYGADDRIGKYESERIALAKSVDEISNKFGTTSNDSWKIKALAGSRYFEKTYEFKLTITRKDRFLYHLKNGNYGQAALGFLRGK